MNRCGYHQEKGVYNMEAEKRYLQWKEKTRCQEQIQKELSEMEGHPEQIEECFGKELEFGTAGLRGKLGAGTNRMNVITVGRVTQGIAEYIADRGAQYKDRGVVIAYDCRHCSEEFAKLAAEIFAANGIKVFLFASLRPTPELSFAIRQLKAAGGVNITASHNPKQYNGYKVYWETGAQVMSDIADKMLEKIQKTDMFEGVHRMEYKKAVSNGNIVILSEEMDEKYLQLVKSLAIHEKEELATDIAIVYTPLNGAGSRPVQKILRERGFCNVYIVEEQKDPDPDFTTVGYPNPEDRKAFALAEKLGTETNAEVLIATDPDSDRMAVEVRDENGSYVALNGNQTGVLLIAYILEGRKEKKSLPAKGGMIKSIVTGDMGAKICQAYGVKTYETLTGFKNICGKIPQLKEEGREYVFGYEESIGYAISEEVRDKDGISAAMYICEMAAYYKKQGRSLLQVLDALYEQYGFYKEEQVSFVLEGMKGTERIKRIMQRCREEQFVQFGGMKIEEKIDYRNGYKEIAKSNVLKFVLEDENWFAVRPSGTEPKIKFYFYAKADNEREALKRLQKVKEDVLSFAEGIE